MPCDTEVLVQDDNPTNLLKWMRRFDDAAKVFANQQKGTDSPLALVKAHAGQKFHIRDLTFDVYMSQSILLYSSNVESGGNLESITWHNNTSVITMINYQNTDALFLGDTHALANKLVTNPLYRNVLDCDIVQVAHHGYGDTGSGVTYKHLKNFKMVLWPDMRGHYDGLNPNGTTYIENNKPYSGVVNVGFNKTYILKEGVTQVYLKDNTCAVITDFVNLNSYTMHDYVNK
jgi:hypothetical protein